MARFESGQIVHHLKFDYRGVIVSVDQTFEGTEQWYEHVARSRPAKDRPWYHVLVHNSGSETYVAECHLELDPLPQPIEHPLLSTFFDELRAGRYIRSRLLN